MQRRRRTRRAITLTAAKPLSQSQAVFRVRITFMFQSTPKQIQSPLCVILVLISGLAASPLCYAAPSFEDEIVPIIAKRCVECHNSKDIKGGLDLSNPKTAFAGGDSGDSIVASDSAASMIIQRISDGSMPPESRGQSQKLPDSEISLLKAWIDNGAEWPEARTIDIYERTTDVRGGLDWWSLQPIRKPVPPNVKLASRAQNPIDQFILAKLETTGLAPAPLADKTTLIRRLYFDVIGLPPTPAAIADFLANDSPEAYEQLVDQLLASEHYGERWARHWLDLIRFAETCGYERDQLKPNIYMYRDWVIKALNSDMPYDQFVTHQLAGDEIDSPTKESVIATGMIRAGTWNDEPNDPADYIYTRLEDMVHTTTSAFIGLTVKCARCHNHKFDPIRQTDYYRTASVFWAGYMGQGNLGGPSTEQLGHNVFGWTDKSATSAPIHRLINGERLKPAEVVEPASLSTIPSLERTFTLPAEGSKTTKRRLQFAQWITSPDHPLTARVFVNRLWLHLMGEGIVRTPNNFGFKGDLPTHPELLDWLAADLIDGGWKVKRIQKLILTSSTYRQKSVHPKQIEYNDADFLNEYWWRANRKRLNAESLRDSILSASGQLNEKMYGPSFFPKMSEEALEGLSKKANSWGTSSLSERSRRSIYMMTKRSRLLPLMTTFNFGDTTLPCGQRDVTIVAPQALALMNNHFVHEQSRAMASRLIEESPDDLSSQVRRAFNLSIGRAATDDEVQIGIQYVNEQAELIQTTETPTQTPDKTLTVKEKLAVWLDASARVQVDDDGGVILWGDSSGSSADGSLPIDAAQGNPVDRPILVKDAINGKPALRFDGKSDHLKLTAAPFWNQDATIIVVGTDRDANQGHREIISNWNSRGRSISSFFLGLTAESRVRFSDAFAFAGSLTEKQNPFILTAINSSDRAIVFQNLTELAKGPPLSKRVLEGPYVIGTQGNINGEYWNGDLAEIIAFDRAISEEEFESIVGYLANKYQIDTSSDAIDPSRLALASLCHALFNLNEFIYID